MTLALLQEYVKLQTNVQPCLTNQEICQDECMQMSLVHDKQEGTDGSSSFVIKLPNNAKSVNNAQQSGLVWPSGSDRDSER